MPDELAYRVLLMYQKKQDDKQIIKYLSNEYNIDEIKETISEINILKKEKLLFSKLDYSQIKPLDSNAMKAMCLNISHDCNLRCKYCFAQKGAFGGNRTLMSFEVGKKALDFLIRNSAANKTLEVDFFGGEPLLNFDVVKQITYYGRKLEKKHNKIFKFTLTTNAFDISDDVIDFLNEEIYNVVISIDGRQSVHDFMRIACKKKGTHAIVLENAKKFIEKRGDKNYYIRGTFTKENLDFLNDVKYLAQQGFKQLSLEPVAADKKLSYALINDYLENIKKEYVRLAIWYLNYRKDKFVNFFHFMISLNDGPCLIKRLSGCGAGFEYAAVVPNGDIFPCHQYVGMDEMKIASINDRAIDKDMAKFFAANNVISKPHCRECWAQFWCGGGCGANAYKFNNDITKPYEMECEMLKKRLECAMAIYTLEKEVNNEQ